MRNKGRIIILFFVFMTSLFMLHGCTEIHIHDFVVVEEIHPTCTEDGKITRKCNCGEIYEEIIPKLGHDYGEYIEEIQPTCDKFGEIPHYHCKRCGCNFDIDKNIIKNIYIEKIPHIYGEYIEEIPSTCTKKGVKGHYHCDVCNKDYDRENNEITNLSIETMPHSVENWHEPIEETCTENGVKGYYICKDCGNYVDKNNNIIEDIVIKATHKLGKLIAEIPATCEAPGVKKHYHCERCGKNFDENTKEIKDLVIPAKGHNYGKFIERVEPTCIEKGVLEHYHCRDCDKNFDHDKNEIDNLEIPYADHKMVNNVCSVCSLVDGSKGLDFVESEDGKGYVVSGIGTCTDSVLYIPSEHNGKPVVEIGNEAFWGNKTIKGLVTGRNLKKIGNYSFSATALENVTILKAVDYLGNSAFSLCDKLKSATIKENITNCGTFIFHNDLALEKVDLLGTNSMIGLGMFESCRNLKEVTMPAYVKYIPSRAFLNCEKLKSIKLPETIETIGNSAFGDCHELWEITIPKNIKDIADYAFSNCWNLQRVTINTTNNFGIRGLCFKNCRSLAQFNFDYVTDNVAYKCENGHLIRKSDNHLIVGCVNGKVPEGVVKIGNHSFYGRKNIKTLTLPSTLKEIDYDAFDYSDTIETIYNYSSIDLKAHIQKGLKLKYGKEIKMQ